MIKLVCRSFSTAFFVVLFCCCLLSRLDFRFSFALQEVLADSPEGIPAFVSVSATTTPHSVPLVQNGQVTIFYTVANVTDEELRGALLATTLSAGVSFTSSSLPVDREGNEILWQVGTLPAFGSGVLEVRVDAGSSPVVNLDDGAEVYASLDSLEVNVKGKVASLHTQAIDESLLQATIDADSKDHFIVAKAGALKNNAASIFAFVRDEIRNEVYVGSLRGARGTLWSGAGNSLDKANLLIALLRASCIPARYAQGSLSGSNAGELILSMFPASFRLAGIVPDSAQTADPANNVELLSEVALHYWVEADTGSGFVALDPNFSGAQFGDTFTTADNQFTEVPDSARHKVTLRMNAELAFPGLFGTTLSEIEVLEFTRATVELVGRPLHLGHFINGSNVSSIFSVTTFNYSPYLVIDQGDDNPNDDPLIRAADYQEVASNFPFASQTLTGLFLEMDTIHPLGAVKTTRSTLLDRIGFDVRQNGGTPNLGDTNVPAISPFDLTSINVSTGAQLPGLVLRRKTLLEAVRAETELLQPQIEAIADLDPTTFTPEQQSLVDQSAFLSQNAFRLTSSFLVERFHELSDLSSHSSENAYAAKVYPAEPRLTVARHFVSTELGATPGTLQFEVHTNLDLRKNDVRIVLRPGQNAAVDTILNMSRGYLESIAETTAMQNVLPGEPVFSAHSLLVEAEAQGISTVVLTEANASQLDPLPLSNEAKARISQAIHGNKIVITPSAMVQLGDLTTVGWYETDLTTGETIGVMEDGSHGVSAETAAAWANIFNNFIFYQGAKVISTCIGAGTSYLVGTLIYFAARASGTDKDDALDGITDSFGGIGSSTGNGLVDKVLGFVRSKLTESILSLFATGPVGYIVAVTDGFLAGVEVGLRAVQLAFGADPPVGFFLSSLHPLIPHNLSHSSAEATVTVNSTHSGNASATASIATSFSRISGNLDTLWTAPGEVALSLNEFTITGATVFDANNQNVGNGLVNLPLGITVPVQLTGPSSLTVNGNGSLGFYASPIGPTAVTGQWNNFSGNFNGASELVIPTERLQLNGVILPSGTYRVSAASGSFSGSGVSTAPSFLGSVAITGVGSTLELGPSSDALNFSGNNFLPLFGFSLSNFNGTLTLSASAGTDTITLNGTNADLLTLAPTPATFSTDQNTPMVIAPQISTSVAGDYELEALAPPHWNLSFDDQGNLSVVPAPGTQAGTHSVLLFARSKLDPSRVASATLTVNVNGTTPGVSLDVVPDPILTVPFSNTELPTAFRATFHNTGPTSDTFDVVVTNPPPGFDALSSETSVVVPAGETTHVGLYLFPTGPLPPPGTLLSFTIEVTSSSDGSISDVETENFIMPEVHALHLITNPRNLSLPPGVAGQTTFAVENIGNMDQFGIELSAVTSPELQLDPLPAPFDLAANTSVQLNLTFTSLPTTLLGSELGARITALFGPDAGPVSAIAGFSLDVAVEGADSANDASITALLLGLGDLSNALRDVAAAFSNLFQDPLNEFYQSQLIANLTSLVLQLDDQLYAEDIDLLVSIIAAIQSGDLLSIQDALNALGPVLESIDEKLFAALEHDFELYLLPSSAFTQANSPSTFQIFLRNTGNQVTSYSIALGALPNLVTSDIPISQITLAPGEVAPPDLGVTLTQTGTNIVPFEFDVIVSVTDPGAESVSRTIKGTLTTRDEGVQVASVKLDPPFVDIGASVGVSGLVLSFVNTPRTINISYRVLDQNSVEVFLGPVSQINLDPQVQLFPYTLAAFDTTGFLDGRYTVEVTLTETDGTAIAGGTRSANVFIGSPVKATLLVTPEALPPGDNIVSANLTVESVGSLSSGLELLGGTLTSGASSGIALKDNLAYIAGGTFGVVVDISDPQNPVSLGTFGSGIPMADVSIGGTGDDKLVATAGVGANSVVRVFDLAANPTNPPLVTTTPLVLVNRQFHTGHNTRGNMVFSRHAGFRFFLFGNDIYHQWGGATLVDISNPLAPTFLGSLFTQTFVDNVSPAVTIEGYGSGYAADLSPISDTVLYQPSTSASGTNTLNGTGIVRVFDVSNPASPVLSSTLFVPGTGHLLSAEHYANQVLLIGTTGGLNDPPATGVSGFFFTGNLVLTILDASNPLNPVITAQRNVPDVRVNFITRASPIESGRWILGDRLTRISDNTPVFGLVDSTQPGVIDLATVPAFPGADTYAFTVKDDKFILVAPPPIGLLIYDLGSLTSTAITSSVRIPKNSGVSVVTNSFNIEPSDIVDSPDFQTLVWDASKHPFPFSPFTRTFSWQLAVDDLQPIESRVVVENGLVDFVAGGIPGSVLLAPKTVTSGDIIDISPASQLMQPGGSTSFDMIIRNVAEFPVSYELLVVGLDGSWVTHPLVVDLAPFEEQVQVLNVQPPSGTPLATYDFTVLAHRAGEAVDFSGSASAQVIVDGEAVLPENNSEGVVVELLPDTGVAGLSNPAKFKVRVRNTGFRKQIIALSADAPDFGSFFSDAAPEVLPGINNFRDISLDLLPNILLNVPADYPFTVNATVVGVTGATGSDQGTVSVVPQGVGVFFDPLVTTPNSEVLLRVINSGRFEDTFTLSLSGPVAPFATLGTTEVTLASGEGTDVIVTINPFNFSFAGSLRLVGAATSQSDPRVSSQTVLSVAVPETSGVGAEFLPPLQELAAPGEATFLFLVKNLGNTNGSYAVNIESTTNDVSAYVVDFDGQPVLNIPIIQLPGLTNGSFLIRASKPQIGEGQINVRVVSLDPGNPVEATSVGVLRVLGGDDLCPDDPTKTSPGVCGCGVPDNDTDQDGVFDCFDQCPADGSKINPGVCGCGIDDADTDQDGIADCDDLCPTDPEKIDPGVCDCGIPDVDINNNGVVDCLESSPVDLSGLITVTLLPGSTTLDRVTRLLTSTATVILENTSDLEILSPFSATFSLSTAGVQMPGALGGPGLPPYDRFYFYLSAQLGDNRLSPGESVQFVATFVRPATVQFNYQVIPFGVLLLEPQPGAGSGDNNLDSTLPPGEEQLALPDLCPADLLKSTPGICGCSVRDLDQDLNGVIDCLLRSELELRSLKGLAQLKKLAVTEGRFKKKSAKSVNYLKGLVYELQGIPTRPAQHDHLLGPTEEKNITQAVSSLKKVLKPRSRFKDKKRSARKALEKVLAGCNLQ